MSPVQQQPDRLSTDPDAGSPGRSLPGRLALGGLLAAVFAVPFTLLMVLVLSAWEPLAELDRDVADGLHDEVRGVPWAEQALEITSNVTDPFVFRFIVVGVAVWLWVRGLHRLALWAVTTAAVGGVLGVLLKLLVERSRPEFPEPLHIASGYSFPSGHALNSFLCVGILLLVFYPALRRKGRIAATVIGAVVVLATGYDRIALGVHYVSDVLAGWAAAAAVIAGTAGAFEVWRRQHGLRPSSVGEGVQPEAGPTLKE